MTLKMSMRSDAAAMLAGDESLATPSVSAQLMHQPRSTRPHVSHPEACVSQHKQFIEETWSPGQLSEHTLMTVWALTDNVQAPRKEGKCCSSFAASSTQNLTAYKCQQRLWSVRVLTLLMRPALERREALNSARKAFARGPPWGPSG